MRLTHRFTSLVLIVAMTLLLTACPNPASSFKAGFNATRPFVQSLVNSRVITQAQADRATGDISNGVDAAVVCENCLKAITSDGPAKKVAKGRCYLTLANSLRGILARRNFAVNARLDQIALLVDGAIAAFEGYYQGTVGEGTADVGEDNDKALAAKLKVLEQRMKAL